MAPAYARWCTRALQFSKIFRHHLIKGAFHDFFCVSPHKFFKISLHRGMCIQPMLRGVFGAVPAGFNHINPEYNVRIYANPKKMPSIGDRAHHESTANPCSAAPYSPEFTAFSLRRPFQKCNCSIPTLHSPTQVIIYTSSMLMGSLCNCDYYIYVHSWRWWRHCDVRHL